MLFPHKLVGDSYSFRYSLETAHKKTRYAQTVFALNLFLAPLLSKLEGGWCQIEVVVMFLKSMQSQFIAHFLFMIV